MMEQASAIGRSFSRAGKTAGSMLRIALWSVFFLHLIGQALLRGDGWHGSSDRPRFIEMVAFGDPRGFRAPLAPKGEQELRIGWLGGSSLRTHRKARGGKREITELVANKLAARDELPGSRNQPVVLSYITRAQRIYGLYMTLLDALERDVDVMVVTLGPMLIYNTHAINRHKWWFPAAIARLPMEAAPWFDYLLLSQPSDWANGLLGRVSPLVRDQVELHGFVSGVPDALSSRQHVRGSARWKGPLEFWADAHAMVLGEKAGARGSAAKTARKQKAMLELFFDASAGTVNDQILDQMLGLLRNSGIPTLVYVAPFDPEAFGDETMGPAIRSIEARMAEKKAKFERPGLKIIAENPSRTLEGLVFQDRVHLIQTGKLVPWLSREIEALLLTQAAEGQES